MAHQDPVDPLSDFDALLRQELSVEPSNHFLPRVREQVCAEPRPTRWRALWTFAPALAAAAVIVVAIGAFVLSRANDASPAPLRDLPASRDQQAPKTEARTANPPSRRSGQVALRRAGSGERAVEPDVIVDVRQREALASFIALIGKGQMTGDAFAKTTAPPEAIRDTVLTIEVSPLAVSPIEAGGVLPFNERK